MKIVGWLWVITYLLIYLISGLWIFDLTAKLYGFKLSVWIMFTNNDRYQEYNRIDRENFGDGKGKIRKWLHLLTFLIFLISWVGLMAAIGLG